MSSITSSIYVLYAAASFISMMTSMLIFLSPLIIAMEISKEEDRSKIAMFQCIGWTLGLSIMPLIFWVVRDWVWFLMLTTLPIGLFALWSKYMIESPRWLATKGHLGKEFFFFTLAVTAMVLWKINWDSCHHIFAFKRSFLLKWLLELYCHLLKKLWLNLVCKVSFTFKQRTHEYHVTPSWVY